METTIAAISTAMSASGIGIVRISGEDAMEIISRIYRSKGGKKRIKEVPSHTIHYGYIYDGEELIDEVLVMICLLYTSDKSVCCCPVQTIHHPEAEPAYLLLFFLQYKSQII